MHEFTSELEELASSVLAYSLERVKDDPPLDGPRSAEDLYAQVGETITTQGLGGQEALTVFTDVLARACISTDHPRNLAYIPSAPSEHANLFDLVVAASALYGGSWQEGAGAVFAENQALRWVADLAGLPASAGGVFAQGGTVGNLSALVVARAQGRKLWPETTRWAIACSKEAHSSITSAANVMDVDVLLIDPSESRKLTGVEVGRAVDEFHKNNSARVFAVVATAGTTNLGIIDDLMSVGAAAKERNLWFHVDGAYGLAALCAPSVREKFNGIENADSFIVDPHKWLFAPFDACALLYRDPELARAVHTQSASYLDALHETNSWNPSDYAINLTRRARGLPFWFSLAANGTDAYTVAMEKTLEMAQIAAQKVREHPRLELWLEPELSVVSFTRPGWEKGDYKAWADKLLDDQIGFCPASSDKGQPILRFAIVNPWTKVSDIEAILATL